MVGSGIKHPGSATLPGRITAFFLVIELGGITKAVKLTSISRCLYPDLSAQINPELVASPTMAPRTVRSAKSIPTILTT
jgi:hypothetical protein